MTNASYTAARLWPVARIVDAPDEFRATVDAEGIDVTDVDAELVDHTVRLTGRGIEEGAARFELQFDLPEDADLDRVRILSKAGRLLVTAPYRAPQRRKLEIERERGDYVIHGDTAPI
jgi:HSP20 family molecular chaperone IbpA